MVSRSSMSMGYLRMGAAILAITVVGVAIGMYLSGKIGLAERLADSPRAPSTSRWLVEGAPFPTLKAQNSAGRETQLSDLWGPAPTVVAFLSGECVPCNELAEWLPRWAASSRTKPQIVLLSRTPAHYRQIPGSVSLGLSDSTLEALDIHLYPQFAAVSQNGLILFVIGGFNAEHPPSELDQL